MASSWIILGTLPLVSAFIGWATNRLAIHMLFHPREPRRFFGLKIQGVIPRRHAEIAEKTGEIVARELIQKHLIKSEIEQVDLEPILNDMVTNLVWDRLGPKLKTIPLIGNMVNDSLLARLHVLAAEEMRREAPLIKARIATLAEAHFDIERIVRERVDAFELTKLEEVVRRMAGREFRQIELFGAFLGGLIGVFQVALVLLSQVFR